MIDGTLNLGSLRPQRDAGRLVERLIRRHAIDAVMVD